MNIRASALKTNLKTLGTSLKNHEKVNEFNYVDCENPIPSSPNSNCHNTLLGVAAPRLIVDFTLPFDSFAPSSVETVFKISTSEGTGFDFQDINLILY